MFTKMQTRKEKEERREREKKNVFNNNKNET